MDGTEGPAARLEPFPGREPQGPEEGHPTGLRRSRILAVFAFILLATACLLPWWTVRLTSEGDLVDRVDLQFWDEHGIAHRSLLVVTAAMAAVAVAFLFVRVAAGSWKHEPDSWRRDIVIATGLTLAALVSAFFWPTGQPMFWDTTAVSVDGVDYVEKARPGLGWWMGLIAGGLLTGAVWTSRRTGPTA